MDQVTDIAQLATVPGALAVALLAVEVAKQIFDGTRRAWRTISIVAATATMLTGVTLTTGLTPETGVLAGLNGMIAGLAASRTYDAAGEFLDRRSNGRHSTEANAVN